jgi:hypothetical protein
VKGHCRLLSLPATDVGCMHALRCRTFMRFIGSCSLHHTVTAPLASSRSMCTSQGMKVEGRWCWGLHSGGAGRHGAVIPSRDPRGTPVQFVSSSGGHNPHDLCLM